MATPLQNFVPVTENINTAFLGAGRFVADGEKWGNGVGVGVTLSFSFPDGGSFWKQPYGTGNEPFEGFIQTTALEQNAIRTALATWAQYANIVFFETTEFNTLTGNVGELRFAKSTDLPNNESAHAYFPSGFNNPQAGDTWFNPTNQFNRDGGSVPVGSFDFQTILHEIGHALGLKHTFDNANFGPANHSPVGQDNFFYSIMSYTASPWSTPRDNFASFYPTTPMYNDLLAIEGLYGRAALNTGNTVYTYTDGNRYWHAINDTAGRDSIVYNGVENSTINLNPGTFSALSEAIFFRRPGGASVSSKATVTIGPNVLIEDARGGNGHDTITGNGAGNVLNGMGGNDTLLGLVGNDYLLGGPGNDIIRSGPGNDTTSGGANNDIFFFNDTLSSTANRDTIQDYNTAQDVIWLENAIFTRLAPAAHLNLAYFRLGNGAVDANDFIIYNRAAGLLLYDPDGSAVRAAFQIAVLSNKPILSASEFTVV